MSKEQIRGASVSQSKSSQDGSTVLKQSDEIKG